jgi:hypothetical protein
VVRRPGPTSKGTHTGVLDLEFTMKVNTVSLPLVQPRLDHRMLSLSLLERI